MTAAKRVQAKLDAYQNTIARIEPEIAMIDRDAALASIAISLKRIADQLENPESLRLTIYNAITEGLWNASRNK